MATVLVIGATGDVGQGIVNVLLRADYRVIAASRGEERLRGLAQKLGFPAALRTLRGSVENEGTAAALLAAIREGGDTLDVVVTTVSAPSKSGVSALRSFGRQPYPGASRQSDHALRGGEDLHPRHFKRRRVPEHWWRIGRLREARLWSSFDGPGRSSHDAPDVWLRN